MRSFAGIALLLFALAPAAADETEDRAAKWAEGYGAKLVRDDKQPGKPVVSVAFLPSQEKKVPNEELKELAGFSKLKKLSLFFQQHVADEALKHVKSLKTLEVLSLNNTSITDEGLEELKDMKQLKGLHLAGCIQVTDRGLEHLAALADLEDLSLPSTIGNAGIKNIAGFKKLKKLYLGNCAATDTSMRHIGEMTELEELYLGFRITDEGIVNVSNLTKLKQLNLGGSTISSTVLKQIQKALPDTTIKP